jgi:hypothetical protein
MNKRAWILIVIFLFMFVASAVALETTDIGEDWRRASYNEKIGMAGHISVQYGNGAAWWYAAFERYYSRPINRGAKIRWAAHEISRGEY